MHAFNPKFSITARIANALMRIESSKEAIKYLPVTPTVLAHLRETARVYSTHYSTMIEGNRLTQEQVSKVVGKNEHFPGRERDEKEVLGYYVATERVEQLAADNGPVTQQQIKALHALVMAGETKRARLSSYRDGQNVIRDGRTRNIVYMPPEAKDVPALMKNLTAWINSSALEGLPCPIRAGIAHYQFATIHPYYDGNGRTARLLTTLVLHLGGYDLKGLYSLEEYYARKLGSYYHALSIGPSHNYYEGRAQSDITSWIEYFCDGVANSFENVRKQAQAASENGSVDKTAALRNLDPRQRKAMTLFHKLEHITSRNIQSLFSISQRTARVLLGSWVKSGLLVITDPSKKSRKYSLADKFKSLQ